VVLASTERIKGVSAKASNNVGREVGCMINQAVSRTIITKALFYMSALTVVYLKSFYSLDVAKWL
jgi:hypothetical protein